MKTNEEKILAFFKGENKEVKLKHPRELQQILSIAKDILQAMLSNR